MTRDLLAVVVEVLAPVLEVLEVVEAGGEDMMRWAMAAQDSESRPCGSYRERPGG